MSTQLTTGFDYPEIFEEFLQPHRYKVAEGGRGGAKSHFFANLGSSRGFSIRKRGCCVVAKSRLQSESL